MAIIKLNGVPVAGSATKRIARALLNGHLQLEELGKVAKLKHETLLRYLASMQAAGMGVVVEGDSVVLKAVKKDWNEFLRICEERLREYPENCTERGKIEAQIARIKEKVCQTG